MSEATQKFMPVQQVWNPIKFHYTQELQIPWAMIEAHDAQAKANCSGQNLERLRERGGISACEALAILEDRPWCGMDTDNAFNQLKRLIAAWELDQAAKLLDGQDE